MILKSKEIALILLNHNSASDCKKCAGFLKKQEGIKYEIVIVDNNSRDDDRQSVEQMCKLEGFAFIANNENKGYNAGNNVGLHYAAEKGYQYSLIANPDMEFPQTNYIGCLIEIMERDEQIAVCGSDIITPEGIHQNPMKQEGGWRNSFGWISDLFKKHPKKSHSFIDQYETSHYCHKVSGCCLMVRMEFINDIGYFDEYPFLYCEEAILSKQVEKSGKWKMYYTSDVHAIHRHVKNEKGDPIPRFRQWKRSRLYYIDNYSGYHHLGKVIARINTRLSISLMMTIQIIKKYCGKS